MNSTNCSFRAAMGVLPMWCWIPVVVCSDCSYVSAWRNGAAKETEVGFLVLVVQTVALFTKNLRGFFDGFFLIEFNAQHAALVLPVMDDADVLILIFSGRES